MKSQVWQRALGTPSISTLEVSALSSKFLCVCLIAADENEMEGGREGGRNEREWGRKKNKMLNKQQESQEKYVPHTMNIVVSSHSLHSQSLSRGRPGSQGMPSCLAGGHGGAQGGGEHAWQGLPRPASPPMNCGLAEAPRDGDRGK